MNTCSNCKNLLEDGVKFCNNCGTAVLIENSQEETAAANPKSRGALLPFKVSKTKLGIGIGSIVCIVIFMLLGFDMFLNKNPKQLYLLSELRTAQNQSKSLEVSLAKEIALQQKLAADPSTIKMDFSVDASYDGSEQSQSFNQIQDAIRNSKLSIEAVHNPTEQTGHYTLAYLFKEVNIFEAFLIRNQEKTGLEIPVLYDKMFYIENSEFGDFMKENDPYYSGPNELSYQEYSELFSFTDEQKDRIQDNYTQFLLDNLRDEYFTLTKDVSYSSPDGAIKFDQISISMSEEQIHQFLMDFIDQIRADQELQQILAQKFVDLMKISTNEELLTEAENDAAYIQEIIEDQLYAFKKEIRKLKFPKGFHMNVMIDGKKRIVDRKINFVIEEDTSITGLAFEMHTNQWSSKDNNTSGAYEIEITSTKGPRNGITLKGETSKSIGAMGEKKDIQTNLTVVTEGEKMLNADLNLSVFNVSEKNGPIKTDYSFDLKLDGSAFADAQPNFQGKLKRSINQNLDKNFSNQQYELELLMGVNNEYSGDKEEVRIDLDFTIDIIFNDSIQMPVIKNDAINVTKQTEDDWYDIQLQMEEALEEFLEEHSNLFDMNSIRL